MSLPLVFPVKQIINEAPDIKTYVFEHNLRAKPGQFIMLWLPGVDEVPMSIGWQTDKEFHLTIANAGDCTDAIHKNIKVGDKLGIRGPYGSTFDYKNYKNIILVGGGAGTPPMLNLSQAARDAGVKVTVVLGGRTSKHLLYIDKFKSLGCDVKVATDDGSAGYHGFATGVVEKELEKGGYDCVYTCGPEIMMVKVANMAKDSGVDCQVSMERYMKCGFGICGQCCLDDSGIRMCKEGPVLEGMRALEHPEFGKYKRNAAGELEGMDGSKL